MDQSSLFPTLCQAWELHREDGTIFYGTNHDRRFTINTNEYIPTLGGDVAAFAFDNSFGVDTSDVKFILDDNAIAYADIQAGLFDRQRVIIYMVDWTGPTILTTLLDGTLGEIKIGFGRSGPIVSTATVENKLAALARRQFNIMTRNCPHTIGSQSGVRDCNLDLSSNPDFIDSLTVSAIATTNVFTVNSTRGDNYYGRVTFTAGDNNGRTFRVASFSDSTNQIELTKAPAKAIQVGDTLDAIIRCPKTLAFCQSVNNAINFGGFPYVPGTQQLIEGGQ